MRSVSVASEGRVLVLLGGHDSDLRRALGSAIRADGCDVIGEGAKERRVRPPRRRRPSSGTSS